MSQNSTEVLECAEDILTFFRKTYPRKERDKEWTLTKRLEILSGWTQDQENQDSRFYSRRSKVRRFREMYERGNIEEIAQYGRDNVDTITGGQFYKLELQQYEGAEGFDNETIHNLFQRCF